LDILEDEQLNSYITDKYAGMLTEDDVANLFDVLVKKLSGNRSEAARRCGLTGKATYDWEGAAYVKLGTKKKVLEASLREIFLETVEYLVGRSTNRTLDLLRTILSTLYANALEATSRNEFKNAFAKFETIRVGHQGMIKDGIRDEAADMTSLLRKKASELGVPLEERTMNEFSGEEMINAIQLIGHVYVENPMEAETFAEKDLGLPSDVLKPIIQTFKSLCFTREMQTTAMADMHKRVDQRPLTATGGRLFWTVYPQAFVALHDVAIQQPIGESAKEAMLHEITTAT
jgi:hypothetical protein